MLSGKGYERAHALVSYFTQRQEMAMLFEKRPLAVVIAQGVDTGVDAWGQSRRPLETVMPLVQALNDTARSVDPTSLSLQIQKITNGQPIPLLEIIKKNYADLITRIQAGEFEGKTIIISWSHQQLPQLALGLGVSPELVPRKWQGGRFDVTWVVEMEQGKESTFSQLPQRLLFEDSSAIIQ
ncbi:hypothetical protein BASA81_008777 [Batrachochytrium salamandrivorans]|nr:hypothetical protein BASA81_008777 [Batrachochytrium salamandrivorans]